MLTEENQVSYVTICFQIPWQELCELYKTKRSVIINVSLSRKRQQGASSMIHLLAERKVLQIASIVWKCLERQQKQ